MINANERYIIREGCSQQGYGTKWWAVVAYSTETGQCLGADAHWLSQELAEHAKEVYEANLAAHGAYPDTVQTTYLVMRLSPPCTDPTPATRRAK